MKVSTEDVRQAARVLLEHLESTGQKTFEIQDDYYWDVPPAGRYNPLVQPKDLTLGQLSDDWAEVQDIVQGRKAAVGYGMVWLAAVLRAVGEKALG